MNECLLLLRKFIPDERHFLQFAFIFLLGIFISQSADAQSFPCGLQDLETCDCDGFGDLVADSEPCTFSSGQLQQFVLIDVPNALVSSDADDNSIVAVSSSGVFNGVPSGDYLVYAIYYEPIDAPFFNGQLQLGGNLELLQQIGTEIAAGFWTSDIPNFTMVASDLATVNGPECTCNDIEISDPCSCDDPNNYVEAGVTYVRDVVTINSSPGQTWTITSDSAGAYDASANPLNGNISAIEVSPGVYEFMLYFVPGIGHTSFFSNGTDELSISNLGQDCICDLDECASLQSCDGMTICTGPQEPVLICPEFCLPGNFTFKDLSTIYHCSVVPEGNGNCFTYTPLPGMENIGQDVIEILAINDDGQCIEMNIDVIVGGCNEPPVASNDFYDSDGDGVAILPLTNDSDPDNDFLYICGYYSDPANGVLVLNNGSFFYTPNPGFTGTDSFTYTVCDGNGGQDIATIYIEVTAAPDCDNPSLAYCTNYMTPLYICPDFCMFDNGEPFAISSTHSTYSCALYVQSDDCIRYTPLPGFYGDDYIQIVACSTQPGHSTWCDTVYAQIEVKEDCNAVEPPCSADMQACTAPMTPTEICIPFCNPNASIVRAQTTYNCSISLLSGTCVRYVPVPGFTGTGHIEVEACDNAGNCEIAMITVDVSDGCGHNGGGRLPSDPICDIDVPDSFVPYAFDNDGRFVVNNLSECFENASAKFSVYNVAGQLVHTTNLSNGDVIWDANEHNWSNGMYIYSLELESDDKQERFTGYINVVR